MEKDVLVLAVESSCDETSVAVIKNGTEILSNIVASQIKSHQRFGGVVPEVASRHHVESVTVVFEEALQVANVTWDDIDAIVVTEGPGLVGSLLIGINAAKVLSFVHNIPLVGVHHIAGHIYANQLVEPLQFPLLALVVSGGHTELVYMKDHYDFEVMKLPHLALFPLITYKSPLKIENNIEKHLEGKANYSNIREGCTVQGTQYIVITYDGTKSIK